MLLEGALLCLFPGVPSSPLRCKPYHFTRPFGTRGVRHIWSSQGDVAPVLFRLLHVSLFTSCWPRCVKLPFSGWLHWNSCAARPRRRGKLSPHWPTSSLMGGPGGLGQPWYLMAWRLSRTVKGENILGGNWEIVQKRKSEILVTGFINFRNLRCQTYLLLCIVL